MAYDETLAARVRHLLIEEPGVAERKMFGGLCFTVSGRMCCGVLGRDLVLRLAPDRWEAALRGPHTRPMDFTGRPMRGFLYVAPAGTRDGRALRKWVAEGVGLARTIAAAGPPRRRRRATQATDFSPRTSSRLGTVLSVEAELPPQTVLHRPELPGVVFSDLSC